MGSGLELEAARGDSPAGERRVQLSGDSAWFIAFTTVIGLPALVLVFGIYHWWRRRNL